MSTKKDTRLALSILIRRSLVVAIVLSLLIFFDSVIISYVAIVYAGNVFWLLCLAVLAFANGIIIHESYHMLVHYWCIYNETRSRYVSITKHRKLKSYRGDK